MTVEEAKSENQDRDADYVFDADENMARAWHDSEHVVANVAVDTEANYGAHYLLADAAIVYRGEKTEHQRHEEELSRVEIGRSMRPRKRADQRGERLLL